MSDLISRDAMLEHIDRRIKSIDIAPDPLYRIAWEIIRDFIEYDSPAVDAVPVVRCRECAYRFSAYCPMRHLVLPFSGPGSFEDCSEDEGYCHKGERTENENT